MSERYTKHTKHERFVKHFLQIERKDENVFKFIFVNFLHFFVLLLLLFFINFYVDAICFTFDGAGLWRGLEVWQISSDVKKKRNSATQSADENDDHTHTHTHTHTYIYINIFCLFIYLFNIFFKLLKLRWNYSAKRESFR